MTRKKPLRILVVESDEDLLSVTALVLQTEGHEVIRATGGSVGIEKARAEKPDLILPGTELPGKTGYEVLLELKSAPETRAIPVIVVTAIPHAWEHATAFGASACLTLPWSMDKLTWVIDQAASHP